MGINNAAEKREYRKFEILVSDHKSGWQELATVISTLSTKYFFYKSFHIDISIKLQRKP